MEIEEYRIRLEEFDEALNREMYVFLSGRKPRLEVQSLYRDYSDLTSQDRIQELARSTGDPSLSDRRRKSLSKIYAFCFERLVESETSRLTEQIAELESSRSFVWDGREVTYFEIPGLLAKEPDSSRRRALASKQASVLTQSESLRRECILRTDALAAASGFSDYADAQKRIKGIAYDALAASFDHVLEGTELDYVDRLTESVQAATGASLNDCAAWDVDFWKSKNAVNYAFSGGRLLEAYEATISDLNIGPERAGTIFLDLEPRPGKHPRAFCVPIVVPSEVKIVMSPRGGADDYARLFHEGGHAHHFAWTKAGLPSEMRICGDRAVTEAFAFLLEHLLLEEEWLVDKLGFMRSAQFLTFQRLFRVYRIRCQAAKLKYEIGLYRNPRDPALPGSYAQIMKQYTGFFHDPESYLTYAIDGLYAADYLRGWMLETKLREYLCTRYGKTWFRNRAAGSFLKEIWETGQTYHAEELARDLGPGGLEPQALADDLVADLNR